MPGGSPGGMLKLRFDWYIITTRQITLHIVCINVEVAFFGNNVRGFGTLHEVGEEIIKLHIFI